MSSVLEKIKKPVANELVEFEKRFKEAMKSNVALLDRVTSYIVKRKGKQVRPMFVFLSAKLCGGVTEATYNGASLVELLHTATLVHDDVVDDSLERRGYFSINALWKNKIAVLVGDFLLSKGLLLAVENGHFSLLKIISQSVKDMSEGELLQMEKARKLDITEEVYFDIIKKKTASLISSACGIGAASTTDNETVIKKVQQLGEYIGIAFQIKDDLFDYGEKEIGKPRGIDIKEKKMTLPLIYALNNAEKNIKRKMINIVKNDNLKSAKVKEVIEFVNKSGGIEYTIKQMNLYKDKAIELLKTFPAIDSRDSLEELINYTIERKF
ncbi:MAG: octaprenyl-diphosphate synthase [Planctomycetota bacterium]|jgi:octaprenyl-diphosphate synthase